MSNKDPEMIVGSLEDFLAALDATVEQNDYPDKDPMYQFCSLIAAFIERQDLMLKSETNKSTPHIISCACGDTFIMTAKFNDARAPIVANRMIRELISPMLQYIIMVAHLMDYEENESMKEAEERSRQSFIRALEEYDTIMQPKHTAPSENTEGTPTEDDKSESA